MDLLCVSAHPQACLSSAMQDQCCTMAICLSPSFDVAICTAALGRQNCPMEK